MSLRRAFLVCAAAAACLLAQTITGVISGTVTDPSQAVVPAATVTIINADTGVTMWHGQTNGSGVYRAPALPAGRYNVTVQREGFKRADLTGVNLAVDQRASVNVTLQPGAVAESVTVTDEAAGQLATDSSSIGSVITTSQVENLPLPDRNILNLLSLTPGVSSGGDATGINANQLSMNGSRTLNSEFMVDGISVVSGSTGGVQTLPPADAIREFKVLTSAYSAEYGRTSGGTVSMIINSGGDHYHGGAYEYFRNEDLNANTNLKLEEQQTFSKKKNETLPIAVRFVADHRIQVGARGGQPPAPVDVPVERGETLLPVAVHVVGELVAGCCTAPKNAPNSGLVAGPRSSTSGPVCPRNGSFSSAARQFSIRLKYGRQCA